jgi:hypothetical protein
VPPGKEGKIELAVEHTTGYSGEIAKSASVSTNDTKLPTFNLVLRARFLLAPPPAGPPTSVTRLTPETSLAAPPAAALNPNVVFTVEPGDRWTTSALIGSSSSNTFYLYNPQTTPAHAKKLIPGGDNFTATLQPLQEGKRYQVTVVSNPSLKPGHYSQTLKVATDSAAQPEVTIQLDLTVYPKVFASPTAIVMPALPINSDLSAITWPMIYVRRVREKGLKIKGYSSTLPFLKLELLTETEDQVYKIRLTLDTTKIKLGEYKGKVRVETDDPDAPFVEIPIQGSFK